MVKLTGPLMSEKASGSLADALTFSSTKGRAYAKVRAAPADPKSGDQVGRRAMFSFLSKNWKNIAAPDQASWYALAAMTHVPPFNAYLQFNMQMWHNALPPMQPADGDRSATGSARFLSAATWEEHRIKLQSQSFALVDGWGFIIYGSATTPFTPAVENTIMVEYEDDAAAHAFFWTPPRVTTWHFWSKSFSKDGHLETLWAEKHAVP